MRHFIYKTTNLVNGKYYIGRHSTDDLDDGYLGSGKILKLAIAKSGRDAFRRDIIEYADDLDKLLQKETEYVTEDLVKDPMCYNVTIGGRLGTSGFRHSDETKRKMSESAKGSRRFLGKTHTVETKQKMRIARLGKVVSDETRRKMRDNMMGFRHSDETKKKISKSLMGNQWNRGKTLPEETRQKMSESHKLYWRKKREEQG